MDLLAAWGTGSDAKDRDEDNTHGLNTQHQQQEAHPDHRHLNFWALPRLPGPTRWVGALRAGGRTVALLRRRTRRSRAPQSGTGCCATWQATGKRVHVLLGLVPYMMLRNQLINSSFLPAFLTHSPSQLLQLHRPLRSALLSMPRRPLAPQPPPPATHSTTQGQAPTSSAPPTAAQSQQQQQQQTQPAGAAGRVLTHTAGQQLGHAHAHAHVAAPTEGEWLRGVARLWAVELQRCTALQSYVLALQRTACAGGGGWPLGGR